MTLQRGLERPLFYQPGLKWTVDIIHSMSRDLRDPRWMYFKALLLLGIGILASVILLIDQPTWRAAALLGLAIWGFSRAYYFAFYVIEHYIDPLYKFAGLIDFALYVARRRKSRGDQ